MRNNLAFTQQVSSSGLTYQPLLNQSRPKIELERIPEIQPDDNYPGTFFRIPGIPVPGLTTWSLSQ